MGEEFGDRRGISDAYEQLGRIALAEGHASEALSRLQQSLLMRREIRNQQGIASCLSHLAIVHLKMKHLPAALWTLWQSLITYQRIGMLSRQRFITILRRIFHYYIED